MSKRLQWYPIPDFVFNKNDDGNDYVVRQIGRFLVNPIGVGVTAEGFGGVSATISGNNLIINEFGTWTDNPYVVLTASRPVSPSAYLPADTEIARILVKVRLITKSPGEDGVGTEIVYAVTDQDSIRNTQYPDNAWGYNNGGTVGGLTWHTDPQSVSAATPNQFIAERQVVGTPDDGDTVDDEWSKPALWSNFAEDGTDGEDGEDGTDGTDGTDGEDGEDGVGTETIYAVSVEDTLGGSQLPDNAWGYNNGGTASSGLIWHTTPQPVSETNPNQFIATRQIIGTPSTGDSIDDDWSMPALWSNFAEDGKDGKDGTDGTDGEDGAGEADLWDYGTWTRTRGNADVVDFSGATEVTGGASETKDISPPLLPDDHGMENVRGTLTGKRESPRQIAVGYVTKNDNMLRLSILKHRTDQAGAIQSMNIYFQGQYQLLQTSQQQSQSTSRRSSAFDKDNGIF